MGFGTCSYRTCTHHRIALKLSLSVCKMGASRVPCIIILLGILRLSDGRDETVSCLVWVFFFRIWVIKCGFCFVKNVQQAVV